MGMRMGTATGRRVLALGCAALLALGACSGDDGEPASTGGATGGEGSGTTVGSTGSDGDGGDAAMADPASVEAAPSAGCGTPAAAEVAVGEAKIDTTGPAADGSEVPRWYLRFTPSAHDGTTPVPLVLDIHGYSEGAEVHKGQTGLGAYGEQEGFVTVMPHGDGPVPRWVFTSGSTDVDFLGQVLDEVEADLCIDTNRIYVTGLSNGAFMTSALMCDLSDRFAAAAPVAGIQPIGDCDPARPIPVVAFHGTDDPFVSWDGGLGPAVSSLPLPDGTGSLGDTLEQTGEADAEAQAGIDLGDDAPSVPEIAAIWAERNGCEPEPTEEPVAEDVVLVTFDCPNGADVELYRIEGGGHTWPGSDFMLGAVDLVGTTTMAIDANEIMWEFFQAHPLR